MRRMLRASYADGNAKVRGQKRFRISEFGLARRVARTVDTRVASNPWHMARERTGGPVRVCAALRPAARGTCTTGNRCMRPPSPRLWRPATARRASAGARTLQAAPRHPFVGCVLCTHRATPQAIRVLAAASTLRLANHQPTPTPGKWYCVPNYAFRPSRRPSSFSADLTVSSHVTTLPE